MAAQHLPRYLGGLAVDKTRTRSNERRSVIKVEFCDGLEMKFLSPIGGIQPIGTSETAAKMLHLVLVSVSDCKCLETRSPWLRAWFNKFK